MRNLLAFLYGYRTFILFILLEGIAFLWIMNSRSLQRSVFINSSSEVTGTILESFSQFKRYIDLDKQNQYLTEENAKLHSLIRESYLPISSNKLVINDTIYQQQYSYINAKVINSSYRKKANYITLNRGSKQGVTKEMGVIGPQGVIGIINGVSENFCTVMPLINPNLFISGKFAKNNFFGSVNWNLSNYQYANLSDIPRYAKVIAGDTIVSDSRSLAFPEGIPIGVVESYELQEDQNFLKVRIRLSTDFSSLHQVYIIKNLLKNEQLKLEEEISTFN